jgi:hypothetical protein
MQGGVGASALHTASVAARQSNLKSSDHWDEQKTVDDIQGTRTYLWCLFCFFMKRVLFTSPAVLHQLEAYFTQLFFVLRAVMCDVLTHGTLELYQIVLGHTIGL